VIAGGADRSYGIEVARMAGLPKQVLNRVKNIMNQMNTKGLPNKRKDLIQESIAQSRIEFVY
jgi:DNA mismatch repair protein MutS